MEVDTAFFGDPDGAKADVADVNLGEFPEFHDEFGYYRRASAPPRASSLKAGRIASSP
jgi:hypothetical protein